MDRRRYKRIHVDLPVQYSRNQMARATNLSLSGLNLLTERFLAKGTIVFLVIGFPDEELKVVGEVRWSKVSAQGQFENGVEFFFMDNNYKKKIKDFIKLQEKGPAVAVEQN